MTQIQVLPTEIPELFFFCLLVRSLCQQLFLMSNASLLVGPSSTSTTIISHVQIISVTVFDSNDLIVFFLIITVTSNMHAKIGMRQNSFILSLFSSNINFLHSFKKTPLLPSPFQPPFWAGVRVCSHITGWMGAPFKKKAFDFKYLKEIKGLKPMQTQKP